MASDLDKPQGDKETLDVMNSSKPMSQWAMPDQGMTGTGSPGEGTFISDIKNKEKEEDMLDIQPIPTIEQRLNYQNKGVQSSFDMQLPAISQNKLEEPRI